MNVRNRASKFKNKAYRNAYMQGHVRSRIAYQIRALREQRGLSQQDLADLLGTTQSVVSRLESTEYGKASVQTLLDIASVLDIALSVKFCSYPEFLEGAADVSPRALRVESYADAQVGTLTSYNLASVRAVTTGTPGLNAPTIGTSENGNNLSNTTGAIGWLKIVNQWDRFPELNPANTGTSMLTLAM